MSPSSSQVRGEFVSAASEFGATGVHDSTSSHGQHPKSSREYMIAEVHDSLPPAEDEDHHTRKAVFHSVAEQDHTPTSWRAHGEDTEPTMDRFVSAQQEDHHFVASSSLPTLLADSSSLAEAKLSGCGSQEMIPPPPPDPDTLDLVMGDTTREQGPPQHSTAISQQSSFRSAGSGSRRGSGGMIKDEKERQNANK